MILPHKVVYGLGPHPGRQRFAGNIVGGRKKAVLSRRLIFGGHKNKHTWESVWNQEAQQFSV
jgi:hypothetical protein